MVLSSGASVFDVIKVIINIGVIWLLFFFTVKLLCIFFPKLLEFINNNLITISVFQISWKTQYYNEKIQRLHQRFPKFFEIWFNIGTLVTIVLVPVSFGLFVYNLVILLAQPQDIAPPIVPIVPGVTVQGRDSIYLFIALLLCMICHELGHALCAYTNNDIRIQDVGLFIVFVFPAAHVTIDSDAIYRLRLWPRLKVFSAGVWHNVALAALVYLLIYSQPILLSPLYHYSNDEVYITKIHQNSLLSNSLVTGDRIVSISNCNIKNTNDYMSCIQKEIDYPTYYCLAENPTIKCLNSKINSQFSNFRECFEYNELLKMKKCSNINNNTISNLVPNQNINECSNDNSSRCIDLSRVGYRYFELIVQSQDPKYQSSNEILPFIGTPMELWTSFRVDKYRARFKFLESFDLPYHLNQFYQYVIQLSLGIAVFNAIPIHALDGEYILETIFNLIFPKKKTSFKFLQPDTIRKLILNISLILLVLNIIMSYFQLFK